MASRLPSSLTRPFPEFRFEQNKNADDFLRGLFPGIDPQRLYRNQCPLGIQLLGVEGQQSLNAKIESYGKAFIVTMIEPERPAFEEAIISRDLNSLHGVLQAQPQWNELQKIHRLRKQFADALSRPEKWKELKVNTAPLPLRVLTKGVDALKNTGVFPAVTRSVEAIAHPEIEKLQESYQSIAEMIYYSPKTLKHSWDLLLQIEQIIEKAEADCLMRESLFDEEKHQLAEAEFIQAYLKVLNDFKKKIHEQKEKLAQCAHLIADQLHKTQQINSVDPMADLLQRLKKVRALDQENETIPNIESPLTPEDVDNLFIILAQHQKMNGEELGDLTTFPAPGCDIQIDMAIGCCRTHPQNTLQSSWISYPRSKNPAYAGAANLHHVWLSYRGVSPASIFQYNLAGYRVFQFLERKRLKIQPEERKQRSVTSSEEVVDLSKAVPYGQEVTRNNSPTSFLPLLTSPFEIINIELPKVIDLAKENLPEDEKKLLVEWKGVLVNQGFFLLSLLLREWHALISELEQGKASDQVQRYLLLIQQGARFVGFFSHPLDHHQSESLSNEFETNLKNIKQMAMTRYFSTLREGKVEEHSYWHQVMQECKTALEDAPSTLNPVLMRLLDYKKQTEKISLKEALEALKNQTGKSPEDCTEILRHFLSLHVYEIDGESHPLHSALGECDQMSKKTGQTPLLEIYAAYDKDVKSRKVSELLAHLDDPTRWDAQLMRESFDRLPLPLRANFIENVQGYLKQAHLTLNHPHLWEKLLLWVNDEQLNCIYLDKISKKNFLELLDPMCPDRQRLIERSKPFLAEFKEKILSRFLLSLQIRRVENLRLMQSYVEALIPANEREVLFEQMDAACLGTIQQTYAACPPEPQILVQSFLGYGYPKSAQGKTHLKSWVAALSTEIFPWNPAVWVFLGHPELKNYQSQWRFEWFKMELETANYSDSEEVLGKFSHLQGEECVRELFGLHAEEAVKLIERKIHTFQLWILQDKNLAALFQRMSADLHQSSSEVAIKLRNIAQKLSMKNEVTELTQSLTDALFVRKARLKELYQKSFKLLIDYALKEPELLPRFWVLDGLAEIALSCSDDKEWNEFAKPLQSIVDQVILTASQKNDAEVKLWMEKIQIWLNRRNIQKLLGWRDWLNRGNFYANLAGDPDWMITQDTERRTSLFDANAWLLIAELPASYKRKLLSCFTSMHLQNMTLYSLAAISIAQRVLSLNMLNPHDQASLTDENLRLELYRVVAQSVEPLYRSNTQLSFEQLDSLAQQKEIKEKGWLPSISLRSWAEQAERSQVWRSWSRKLHQLGIRRGIETSAKLSSWVLGSCVLEDPEILSPSNRTWVEIFGVDVIHQGRFIPGLLFEDLFLSLVTGYCVQPYDLLKVSGNSSPVILRNKPSPSITFETLSRSTEQWSLDSESFSALFIFNLLWGIEDHPSEYQCFEHPTQKSTYIIQRHIRPSVKPQGRQEPPSDNVPSVEATARDYKAQLSAPSFLFCCREAMKKTLDPSILEWILELDPALTLETLIGGWSWYLQRLVHLSHSEKSKLERITEWDGRFGGIIWSPERIQNLLSRLQFLQKILRQKPELTLEDILGSFDPLGGYHYTIFNEPPLKLHHLLKQWPVITLTRQEVARIFYNASIKTGGLFHVRQS